MTSCWPSGPPAIGTTAELSRTIGPDDIEPVHRYQRGP